jgi:hypothetical protein
MRHWRVRGISAGEDPASGAQEVTMARFPDILGGAEPDEEATDTLGGAEPDEEATDTLGGADLGRGNDR